MLRKLIIIPMLVGLFLDLGCIANRSFASAEVSKKVMEEFNDAKVAANAYLKDLSINTVGGYEKISKSFARRSYGVFKEFDGKFNVRRCEDYVKSSGLDFTCSNGTGKFPLPNTPQGTSYIMHANNWKVSNIEYTFIVPQDSIDVQGFGNMHQNKVTDTAGGVTVVFQFDSDRIHVIQATYPSVYNSARSDRKGNLAANTFTQMVDNYWERYMLMETKLYFRDLGSNPTSYYLMNAFVSMLANKPAEALKELKRNPEQEYISVLKVWKPGFDPKSL